MIRTPTGGETSDSRSLPRLRFGLVWRRVTGRSLADAKSAENTIEYVVCIDRAHDSPQIVKRRAHLRSRKLLSQVHSRLARAAEAGCRQQQAFAAAGGSPRDDRELVRPLRKCQFDHRFQLFDSLIGMTAGANSAVGC